MAPEAGTIVFLVVGALELNVWLHHGALPWAEHLLFFPPLHVMSVLSLSQSNASCAGVTGGHARSCTTPRFERAVTQSKHDASRAVVTGRGLTFTL